MVSLAGGSRKNQMTALEKMNVYVEVIKHNPTQRYQRLRFLEGSSQLEKQPEQQLYKFQHPSLEWG